MRGETATPPAGAVQLCGLGVANSGEPSHQEDPAACRRGLGRARVGLRVDVFDAWPPAHSPEQILRALLLQILFTVREWGHSEHLLSCDHFSVDGILGIRED